MTGTAAVLLAVPFLVFADQSRSAEAQKASQRAIRIEGEIVRMDVTLSSFALSPGPNATMSGPVAIRVGRSLRQPMFQKMKFNFETGWVDVVYPFNATIPALRGAGVAEVSGAMVGVGKILNSDAGMQLWSVDVGIIDLEGLGQIIAFN